MDRTNNVSIKRLRLIIVVIFISIYNSPLFAKAIEVKMPSGLLAKAEYSEEDKSNPAVLILHGFLQTHNANTIIQLSSHLTTEGYSVLAPSLTLGVSKRKQSLSCDAIHTHSMDDDINEIDFWVNWLAAKGFKDVYIVGHSFGSLHSVVYAAKNKHSVVRKLIATSLVDNEHSIGSENHKKQLSEVKKLVAKGNMSLGKFKISFCGKYVSPPSAFMSYAKWNQNEILKLLGKIKTPIHIILGSSDKRIDSNWSKRLKDAGAELTLIDGANHFFAAEHEFDLADSVISLISGE